MSNTVLAAYMVFRKLSIERRHMLEDEVPKPTLWQVLKGKITGN
jgi:hypothetical protein